MGCIAPNSIKSELSVHSEGSKQCIVPGYTKSKLKDCYTNSNCVSNWPGNARQLERNQTPGRFRSMKIDSRRSSGRFHPKFRHFYSKLPAQSGTHAEAVDLSILARCGRAIRTPANRRGTAKLWWKQTKSGSGASTEPPGVDQELRRLRVS